MIDFICKFEAKPEAAIADLLYELSILASIYHKHGAGDDFTRFSSKDLTSNQIIQREFYEAVDKLASANPYINNYNKRGPLKKSKKPKAIDLFAGCGGLGLGIEQAGFELSYVNDISKLFAATHYFNHRLSTDRYFVGDIHALVKLGTLKNQEGVDLVCGGPPCQGFSNANRQRLSDDPRNHLYKAFLQALAQMRPKFFIMENVAGITARIDDLLRDFKYYLPSGYDFSWHILNANHFGVPQNRKRFILIGNKIGAAGAQIFKDFESRAEPHTLADALKGLPKLGPNTNKNKSGIENSTVGFRMRKYDYIGTLYENYIGGQSARLLLNHKNRFNNARDIEIYRRLPQGGNAQDDSIADIMPYKSRAHIFKDKYFRLKANEACKTITSHMKFDCNMYIHPYEARGLSAREAARIQTFPDSYYFRGTPNQWYSQIGNAVPVKMAHIIGATIMNYL